MFYNARMNDTTERTQKVTIYTDGSCLGNPGPGGWAALLMCRGTEKMLTGHQAETTNNQMEMQAVISALTALKLACDIELFTDSKYVMDGATSWIHGWKAKGWKNSKKEPVKNKERWQQLDEAMQRHTINWHWVKGHAGDVNNERVDEAARAQAEQYR